MGNYHDSLEYKRLKTKRSRDIKKKKRDASIASNEAKEYGFKKESLGDKINKKLKNTKFYGYTNIKKY
jgi:hypothetical protein